MAKRLGIVYCLNRPCALYSIKIPFTCKHNTPSDTNPEAKCLTEGSLSAMSPKFSPKGDKLVFLSHDAAASSGVHCATAALKSIPWSSGRLQQHYQPSCSLVLKQDLSRTCAAHVSDMGVASGHISEGHVARPSASTIHAPMPAAGNLNTPCVLLQLDIMFNHNNCIGDRWLLCCCTLPASACG